MVSAGASAERERGLELGADDVLSLPINDHELLARVTRNCGRTGLVRVRASVQDELLVLAQGFQDILGRFHHSGPQLQPSLSMVDRSSLWPQPGTLRTFEKPSLPRF